MATAMALLLLAAVSVTRAETARVGVIGFGGTYEQGLRDGLRDLGYVEGKSVTFELRRSTGTDEDLRSVAADLARFKLDVVVAFSTPAARAALSAAVAPVVFLSSDPVPAGLAASLAKPGGNATGVSLTGPELTAKRVEYLRMQAPRARRVGCLVNLSNPVGALQLDRAQAAGRALGIEIVKLQASNVGELDAALRMLGRSTVDAILITGDPFFLATKAKIGARIRRLGLPAISPTKEYLGDGALMSYGPSLREAGRVMAAYVDKILNGAQPAEIPIEQLSSYELVIDLREAQTLKLKVPQDLILRANEVIR